MDFLGGSKLDVVVACLVVVGTLAILVLLKYSRASTSQQPLLSQSHIDIREKRRFLYESKKTTDVITHGSSLPVAKRQSSSSAPKPHVSETVTESAPEQSKRNQEKLASSSSSRFQLKLESKGITSALNSAGEPPPQPTAVKETHCEAHESRIGDCSVIAKQSPLAAPGNQSGTPLPCAQRDEHKSGEPLLSVKEQIFGTDQDEALADVLLAIPSTNGAIRLAASWWSRAIDRAALDQWRDPISQTVSTLLHERLPEEDLFTPHPADDLATIFVDLLGYVVVSTHTDDGMGATLRLSACRVPMHSDFTRMLFGLDSVCSVTALRILFSPFDTYRLDRHLLDTFSSDVLNALTRDRSLSVALGVVLGGEAKASATLLHPGDMTDISVLAPLLRHTAIVPFAQIPFQHERHLGHATKYPQICFFETMPTFAAPNKIGCPNQVLLLQQMKMVRVHQSALLEPLCKILELGLKLKLRDSILAWFSRLLLLTHRFFSVQGRDGSFADTKDFTVDSAPFCSSGFTLNVISLILRLFMPLCRNPSKHLSAIEWEFLLHDFRVDFSVLPNMVDGSKPGASDGDQSPLPPRQQNSPGFASETLTGKFSFPTEIFWLTARAMELLDKMDKRRGEQLRRAHHQFSAMEQLFQSDSSPVNTANLEHSRKCYHTLLYGWESTQLSCPDFLSDACSWAKFASDWIMLQASSDDGAARCNRIPAGLVKGMCSVWTMAAHHCPDVALPGIMAADAALFCVELMSRPELASSPVVQDCLLTVVETFVKSGKPSLVGVVMDNQRIRETLAPALMCLYSACHAVAALDVNEDISFDKNSIRYRSNGLIIHLYKYPLDEPRRSILTFAHSETKFDSFVGSAFDCIIYVFVEAVKTLAAGRQSEQAGRPSSSHAKGKVKSLLRISNSTFSMLRTLCDQEVTIRERMLAPSLRHRVASSLYTCLNCVYTEGKLESLRVNDPAEWGYDENTIIGHPVNLLVSCLCVSDDTAKSAFVSALAEHPDFECGAFIRLSSLPGGAPLQPYLVLLQVPAAKSLSTETAEGIVWEEWASSEEAAEELYAALLESYDQGQVATADEGFGESHYFKRLHASTATSTFGSNVRAIVRDYNRKTPSMLPPVLRDATVAIRYDDGTPCYCRGIVSGPPDTPYFGGIFVFDIFLPKDYPNVPPQVQFLNTGGGTERFHPNLYADGKVCISLLGTFEGNTAERWDPQNSCIGQVLVSIQSLILGEYVPSAIGQHVTVDGRHVSMDDYYDYRIATVRYAMIAVLQGCRGAGSYAGMFPEFLHIMRSHFIVNRHRIMTVLRSDLQSLWRMRSPKEQKLRREIASLLDEFRFLDHERKQEG